MKSSELKVKNSKLEKSFTLIEMLVTLGIFSIIITIAASLFITILSHQTKANLERNIAQEARNIMEIIVREARLAQGNPPFSISGPNTSKGNNLTINITEGQTDFFNLSDKKLYLNGRPISSTGFEVSQIGTTPIFILNSIGPLDHPSLTVQFRISAKGKTASQQATVDLRTTVSSRAYAQ